MPVGSVVNRNIQIDEIAATTDNAVLGVIFSDGWEKIIELYELVPGPGGPVEKKIDEWDNINSVAKCKVRKLTSGKSYRVKTLFRQNSSSAFTAPPANPFDSSDSNDIISYWQWDLDHQNPNSTNKAGITIVLVDNNMGPGLGIASMSTGTQSFSLGSEPIQVTINIGR